MEEKTIKDIQYEEVEVEIKETYVDTDGLTKERKKIVKVPDFNKPPKIIYNEE